jgi:hypothetical protein
MQVGVFVPRLSTPGIRSISGIPGRTDKLNDALVLFAGITLIAMMLIGTLLARLPLSGAMIYLGLGCGLGPAAVDLRVALLKRPCGPKNGVARVGAQCRQQRLTIQSSQVGGPAQVVGNVRQNFPDRNVPHIPMG